MQKQFSLTSQIVRACTNTFHRCCLLYTLRNFILSKQIKIKNGASVFITLGEKHIECELPLLLKLTALCYAGRCSCQPTAS